MKEETAPMAAAGLKKAKATTDKRVQTVAVKARATMRRRVRSTGWAASEKHSKLHTSLLPSKSATKAKAKATILS